MNPRRRLSVHDGNRDSTEQAERDKTLLVVREAIILESESRPSNTLGASTKSNPCSFRLRRRFLSSQENRIGILYIHRAYASN
jgi:hypothetical protein